jgi:hypothetical protein
MTDIAHLRSYVQELSKEYDVVLLPKLPLSHRHVKRESMYSRVFASVEVQTSRPIVEGDMLTVYKSANGKVWARLDEEFGDGRFEDIS